MQEKNLNHLCIPYYAPAEILSQFPPVRIIAPHYDACLDENVEFAKLLKMNNVDVQFEGILL